MAFETDLQKYIHISKYARWIEKENRRETWGESVSRLINFWKDTCCYGGGINDAMFDFSIFDELESAILNHEIMPSMRGMMTAGKALDRDNIALYNCTASAIIHPAIFSEAFYILMNGCFDKNTLIKTKDGAKKICDITTNDDVLTYNTESGEYYYTKPDMVFETPQSVNEEKIELEFEDGSVYRCTSSHEFYTTNRGWVKAGDLTEDEDVENYNEIKP